ncbi:MULTISPECIES: T9SS type A sorting domain-containing protein [Flavobacterium]|uniref:T9SS type A sorting domain-containing protein n=1 Tax=Flavobacterium TaxID=237 RepID=UPI001FCADC6A|nr:MULTISPECIES: T9SS type A sorting domain-containing protein [Flavobacterium]UOK42527.1 T9SS type A sorting domain-containing protein [Flavobacterium enshiense]
MKKIYFFGIMLLLYTTYGLSQNCGAGFTLSSSASSICSADPVTLTLSGSETGINYQLRNGSVLSTVGGSTGNPISFTVNPTTTTTYDVIAVGCASPYDSITITVIPPPSITLTTGDATQTICQNTPFSTTTYNIANATGASVTGLPTGVTGSYLAGVVTIAGTPTVSGNFNFTVTTSGGCAPPATAAGTISVTPLPAITLTSGDATQTICQNTPFSTTTYNIANATGASVTGLPTGVTGSYLAGVVTIAGTPTVSGNFNFTVTTSGGCAPPATAAGTISVTPLPAITLTSGDATQTICRNTAFITTTYNIANATNASVTGLPTGVTGSYSTGVVTIAGTPTVSGNFNFTVTTSGGCAPPATAAGTISVTPLPAITLTSGDATQTICRNTAFITTTYNIANATNASVTGLPTGITGSYSTGVVTIAGTPTVSGNFNFTVTTSGGCAPPATAAGTISVTPLPAITLTSGDATQTICRNTAFTTTTYNIANATNASVTGLPTGVTGSYSTGVVTIAGTPTVSGNFNFTVTTSGGCAPPATAMGTINVTPLPNIALTSANATQTRCRNIAIANITYNVSNATGASVTGLPTGVTGSYSTGVFTITGTPTVSGAFNFTVTTSGGCAPPATATGTISVTPLPAITLTSGDATQTICQNTPFITTTYNIANATGASVTGLPTGVTGSYLAGVVTIAGTPTVSGTFNFTVTTTGGCAPPATASGTINVTVIPTASISYSPSSFCVTSANQNINLTGTGAFNGGTYTAAPAGLSINFGSGRINPGGSTAGTYTVTYTIPASGGCAPVPVTTTVTITPVPTASISYPGNPFCNSIIETRAVTLSGTGAYTGGTYSASPSNLPIDLSTGAISPHNITAGTYTVTYTIPASGGCSPVSVTTSVTITAIPTATISYAGPFCKSVTTAQNVTRSGTGAFTGGTYSAPGGLTINASTGAITPSTSTAGTYTVTYTTPPGGGCAPVPVTTTVTITPVPTATISYAGAPFCISTSASQNVTLIGTGAYTGGSFTASPAGLSINSSTGVITPSASTAAGTYIVTYTIPPNGGCAAVPVTTSVTITAVPTASISYTGAPYCLSVTTPQNVTLTGSGTYTGGTYSASPTGLSINPSTGAITPNASLAGTHTVTYTIPASGGCASTSVTTNVLIDNDPVGGTLSLDNSQSSITQCFLASGNLYLSGYVGRIVKWQYSTTGGTSWVDVTNPTTAHSYSNITQTTKFRVIVENLGGCSTASTICTVYVIPNIKPSPVSASPSTICVGGSSVLSATSGFATSQNIATGGDFQNANPAGWTVDSCTNNCLNAGASNTDPGPWKLSATNGGTYSGTNYLSIGKFAIANGNFNSQLYTPIFNTIGLTSTTSARLQFTHAYNLQPGAIGTVEIAVNGGPWTTLSQYTGSSGVPSYSNFLNGNIDLTSYIGLTNLRIRFNYQGTLGSSWAVDNIGIPNAPAASTVQWVDSSGNPLPGPEASTNTYTVSPTTTTTYGIVSVYNGCVGYDDPSTPNVVEGIAYVTVTVNPRPTALISQDQYVCYNTPATLTVHFTGSGPYRFTLRALNTVTNAVTNTVYNNITPNASGNYTFNTINLTATTVFTISALNDSKCNSISDDIDDSTVTVTVLNGTAGLWTGLISSDWFNCLNWAGGLPSATVDAVIPTVTIGGRMPAIDNASPFATSNGNIAIAKNLIINTGARVSMDSINVSTPNLHIKGNWQNSGRFYPGRGTVTFNSSTANFIHNMNTFAGNNFSEEFWNLTLNCTNTARGVITPDLFKLLVRNDVNLTSGDLRLTGEAQLIQEGASANPAGGTGVLLRDQQGTKSSYHYNQWSSPVSADNLNYTIGGVLKDGTNADISPFSQNPINFGWGYDFSDGPLTSPIKISNRWLYKYAATTSNYFSWQAIGSTGSIKIGEGFTMKGVTGLEPNTNYQNYVFAGKPNNGNIDLPIEKDQIYLIGNPYPSALDANKFIENNIKQNGNATKNVINGALYFWDHFGGQTHYLAEYVGGFAVYNLTGGVIAISNDPMINNNNTTGSKIPKRYIPVAQGFFVSAETGSEGGLTTLIEGGTITINNNQRVFKVESPANSIFFKSTNNAVEEETDNRQKIRLGFESAAGLHRQLLLGTDANTSNLFDLGYDAMMFDPNQDDMYWYISNEKFVIQAVNNFNANQIIPIGITISTVGTTNIMIDELENIPASTQIYLFDSITGLYHDLRNGNFTAQLPIGEYHDRFSLRFTIETLSANDMDAINGILVFADSNHMLNIKNNLTDTIVDSVQLFNILGQSIAKWNVADEDQQNIKIPVEHIRSGIYIVKLKASNGWLSKKVIIR